MVATPIGNLGDISERARQTLASADVIAAEDTRRTRALLSHLGISGKRIVATHSHNEDQVAQTLVDRCLNGESVALVSDAGTPGISDPGSTIVGLGLGAGVRVVPVAGPSSLVAAVSVSGLTDQRFIFEGFLPTKPSLRRNRLATLAQTQMTFVLFEAPHRLGRLVEELQSFDELVEREVVVCRELTKLHEQVLRIVIGDIREDLVKQLSRGELVLAVLPGDTAFVRQDAREAQALEILRAAFSEGCERKLAVALAVRITGEKRNWIYQLSLQHFPSSGN